MTGWWDNGVRGEGVDTCRSNKVNGLVSGGRKEAKKEVRDRREDKRKQVSKRASLDDFCVCSSVIYVL